MKTRTFRNGKSTCKSYLKPVGRGWEVGFTFGSKPLFVGNFVFRNEANAWYTKMNKEIRTFAKRFKVGKTYPQTWFRHFLKAHLYRCYYSHLNQVFRKHTSTFKRGYNKELRQYKKLNRRWKPRDKTPALRAA